MVAAEKLGLHMRRLLILVMAAVTAGLAAQALAPLVLALAVIPVLAAQQLVTLAMQAQVVVGVLEEGRFLLFQPLAVVVRASWDKVVMAVGALGGLVHPVVAVAVAVEPLAEMAILAVVALTQEDVGALAVFMAVGVLLPDLILQTEAQVVVEQFALFGPVILAVSHQPALAIFNQEQT